MNIVVISGSPKPKGNTLKTVKQIEAGMKSMDSNVDFTYIELNKTDLKPCIGCYRCLKDGQEYCPLKDDQKKIETLMDEADGVIFATPVYVANVSWLFKNFVDRFAYVCHRPRYHGKPAMSVCDAGAVGTGIVNIITTFMVEVWGYDVAVKLGTLSSMGISAKDRMKQEAENDKKIICAAQKFYQCLSSEKKPKARIKQLMTFHFQRLSFRYADHKSADYRYWAEKGWLDKDSRYYIDAKASWFWLAMARLFASMMAAKQPKGVNESAEAI